jgi:glutathione S-transferase
MTDKKIILYHAPRSRSLTVYCMLEELGVPYELKLLNLRKGDQKKPDYLAINPMGKVPALKFGDEIITETPAICLYLADAYPEKKLNFNMDSGRRGEYLKWMFFTSACLEPAVIDHLFKRDNPDPGSMGYGTFGTVVSTLEKTLAKGPWIMGEQFCAADVVLGSAVHWADMVGAVKKDSVLFSYATRIRAREAHIRTAAADQEIFGRQEQET